MQVCASFVVLTVRVSSVLAMVQWGRVVSPALACRSFGSVLGWTENLFVNKTVDN